MRTVAKTYTVYKFDELSMDAKETVRNDYVSGLSALSDIFTEGCVENLVELFPHSDLDVQYSLSSCQGDGLNIYGAIRLDEILSKIRNEFTENELNFLDKIIQNNNTFNLKQNERYCYCLCNQTDFSDELYDFLEVEDDPEELRILAKFSEKSGDFLTSVCKEMEKNGYEFFYPEITDADLSEWAEDNNYEFLENGQIFS